MNSGGCSHPDLLPHNHPFDEIIARVDELAKHAELHQKFTCVGCGQRLVIEEANKFYERAKCDQCGAETNIRETGCNYLMVLGLQPLG